MTDVDVEYQYELRRGDEVVATGRLFGREPPEVGERIEIAGREGIVRVTDPVPGEPALHVVVQLLEDPK